MDERGQIYAAPEAEVPAEDVARLSRWQQEILEKIESGDPVLAETPRQLGLKADLIAAARYPRHP